MADGVKKKQKQKKRYLTLKNRLRSALAVMAVPGIIVMCGFLLMIRNYTVSYVSIMENLKVANEYSISFKEDMEYSMYRVLIGLIDVEKFQNEENAGENISGDPVVKNPYTMIEHARKDFSGKISHEAASDGDFKIRGILSCLDSLETAVDRMVENAKMHGTPGTYDANMTIWENDIQGLCSMIQEYINQYIYYETLKMEKLQKELEQQTLHMTLVMAMLELGGIIISLSMSAYLTRAVTNPIHNLQEVAEKLGRGEFEAHAGTGKLEEINVLARTFNNMSEQIRGLLDKTRQEQENLRQLELKLRQEQINPHFLYNTLDSIVWMAEAGNERQVVEMTSDLSDFFRTVLSEGRDFITVKEEKSHILSYLKIQKLRYEDILDYKIEIEPDIEECIMLKMILQPVVENALYHGIKNKRGGGTITVRGYQNQNGIVFEVADDGIGMTPDELERLRDYLVQPEKRRNEKRSGGFGMNNVMQRIRMYYGEEAGITVESEKQVGTCVRICLGK
ncbi:MAG: sensor histidine kinase [Lachnospiraceae bacterium]|nr:sensor histidine kinase [Lachnospiraceae bacterium]